MCPKTVVERWASFVKNLAQDKYGHTPDIKISGTELNIFKPNQSFLLSLFSPQAAQLGIHFYCFHNPQLEMHLLEGP